MFKHIGTYNSYLNIKGFELFFLPKFKTGQKQKCVQLPFMVYKIVYLKILILIEEGFNISIP